MRKQPSHTPSRQKQCLINDRDATVYYYENDGRRKIVCLALRFSDARYTRMMEIHVLDPERKSYYYLLTAGLSRRSGDPDLQAVDFPMPVSAPLKLIILDGDNEPLSLVSCKAVIPREELIFELPLPGSNTDEAAPSRLRVYYGNPYAHLDNPCSLHRGPLNSRLAGVENIDRLLCRRPQSGIGSRGGEKREKILSPLPGRFITGKGSFFEEHDSEKRRYVRALYPERGSNFLDIHR